MRRLLILTGAVLCFSISAAAQGAFGVGGDSVSPIHPSSSYLHTWEVSMGYQYDRLNLTGTPFNTNAFDVSITRFVGPWLGAEGQFSAGFGNTGNTTTPASLDAKSLFVGGGPRVAARRHGAIVPWGHFVVGMEHLRFSQTAGLLGSNSALAFEGGGGVDIHLNGLTTIRTEADEIETRFFSASQRHFQVATGLVFGF